MYKQDLPCLGSVYDCCFNIKVLLYSQYHASCKTGIFGPAYCCDGDNGIYKVRSQHTGDCDCKHQTGERDHHICDTHDHTVHDSSEVSGDHSKKRTDHKDNCHQT